MSNHETKVVRLTEPRKHPNADSLELFDIDGFQVVVKIGHFKAGDLGIYVQPDSIVPEISAFSFVWERDGSGQVRALNPGEPVPEKYRRVTVRKFRKEWSEGLLMPISDFPELQNLPITDTSGHTLMSACEGMDVSEILGITHYNPPDPETMVVRTGNQYRTRPKSLKGWFYFLRYWALRVLSLGFYDPYKGTGGGNEKAPPNTPPVYDVENFKKYQDVFVPGEEVRVTEKIHGSNARYVCHPNPFGFKIYAGSRQFWKSETSVNVWRKILNNPYNCDLSRWLALNSGYVIYGEAVPTQGGFDYTAAADNPKLFVFDIMDPQGNWVPYDEARSMTAGYAIDWAPLLYKGPFDLDKILAVVDGKTKTGAEHIREGVVIRTYPDREVRGLGRAQLKIVSNGYLSKA